MFASDFTQYQTRIISDGCSHNKKRKTTIVILQHDQAIWSCNSMKLWDLSKESFEST